MTHYATTPNILTRLKGYSTNYELTTPVLELALEDSDNYINSKLDEDSLSFTTATPEQLKKSAEYFACYSILVNFSDTSNELPAAALEWKSIAESSLNAYIKANEDVEDNSPYQSSMTPSSSYTDYDTQSDYDDEAEDLKDIIDGTD